MKYRVYLEQDEDGMFVATCPSLPGCISQGRPRAEAHQNIREAVALYSVPNHNELAKGTLRALIRDAGLTLEEFLGLL